MSKRTVDLLHRWAAETIRPVPEREIQKEAKRLATEFTAFAVDAGMNLENLEDDISAPLETFMADALRTSVEASGDSAES